MLRWTRISPGLEAVRTLSGTLESAQPIQSIFGVWAFEEVRKKSGSFDLTWFAHWTFEERRERRMVSVEFGILPSGLGFMFMGNGG